MPILAKGLQGTLARAAQLPRRYGLRPDRLRSRLTRMVTFLDRWDVTPTVPVTALLLDRHRELAASLRGVDLAIHGYRHVRYTELTPEERLADIDAATAAFTRCGLMTRGFRAPYLQRGDGTLQLLHQRGFLFDSSSAVFALPASHSAYAGAISSVRSRYGSIPSQSGMARADGPVVELAVSLPDDEILVDALKIRSPRGMWGVYEAMMQVIATAGGTLILQIHPERFQLCQDALALLLQHASDMGAWSASLSELADWIIRRSGTTSNWPQGRLFALCVTGDLDAVALTDFASRLVGA